MIDVTAAQAKNLQTEMQQKKTVLGDLLAQLHERNAKLDATPDIWPTAGGEITSRFGGRANPFSGTGYDYHPGIDIGNDYGAPVYAAQPVMWNTQAGTAVTPLCKNQPRLRLRNRLRAYVVH